MSLQTARQTSCVVAIVAAILALAGGVGLPATGYAQGITLPSSRVIGPSPEIQRLIELVDEAAAWYSPTDTAQHRKWQMLELVRYRLLLAPFDTTDLRLLQCNISRENIWERLYAGPLQHSNSALALAVRRTADAIKSPGRDATHEAVVLRFAVNGASDIGPGEDIAQYLERKTKELKDSVAKALAHNDSSAVQATRPDADPVALRRSQLSYFFRVLTPAETRITRSEAAARSAEQCGAVPPQSVAEDEAELLTQMVSEVEPNGAIKARLDTLGRTARLVVIERNNQRFFFPVTSTERARVFWRQQGFSPLNIGSFTGNATSGAAFTELTSPLLHAVRMSLNTVLAASDSNKAAADSGADESALTRFVNGGGQLNIGAAWPLLFWKTPSSSLGTMILIAPRLGGTLSGLGAVQKDATAFVDPAIEWHVSSTEVTEGIGLFLQARTGFASGGAKFGEAMGLEGGKRGFRYATVAGGLMFSGKYLLSAGKTVGGPSSLQKLGLQAGITVIRGAQ